MKRLLCCITVYIKLQIQSLITIGGGEDENKCLQMTIDKLNERIEEMLNKSDTED